MLSITFKKFSSSLGRNCGFVLNTKNSATCAKMTAVNLRDECYFDAATSRSATADCPKITDPIQKDNCYRTIAINTDNVGLCSNISNENMRQNCQDILAGL